jgi:hypothetical protein
MFKKIALLSMVSLLAISCQKIPEPAPQTDTPPLNSKTELKVAVIALEDNGKSGEPVGCGDSVVYITREVDQTSTVLEAALQQLFNLPGTWLKEEEHKDLWKGSGDNAGLYNAVHSSVNKDFARALKLNRVEIQNNIAKIYLDGEISLGGVCDDPRFKAQIEKTATQFPSVQSIEVYLNGTKLDWPNFGSQK